VVHEESDPGVEGCLGQLYGPDIILGNQNPGSVAVGLVKDIALSPPVGLESGRRAGPSASDHSIGAQ